MADKILLDYEVKLDGLKKEMAELKAQMKGAENTGKKAAKETEKAFNSAGASINRYGIEAVKSANQADKAIQRVNNSTRDLATNTNKVADRTAAGFNKVGDSVRTVGKSTSVFSGLLPGLTSQLGTLAAGMGAAFAVQQIVAFSKASIEAAANFEKAVSELSSITGVVGQELDFYREAAKELSVADIGGVKVTSSAEDIVKAFSLVGSAKPELLASKEALKEVTTQAIILAEASGLQLPDAVKALTDVMNQFGAPADEAVKYIDALAAGAKYGAVAIPQVAEAMVKFGAAAKSSNVSVAESTALIETLGEKGLAGAEAGTALRNILLKLSNAAVLPREAQKAFKQAGVDVQILMDKTLPLEDRLREVSKVMKVTGGITRVFGTENAIAAQNLLANIDRYDQLAMQIQEVGVAQEQAKINTDNYAAKLKQFNNQIELLKIALGDSLIPAVTKALQGYGQKIQELTILTNFFTKGAKDGFQNFQDVINKLKLNDFRGALDQISQGFFHNTELMGIFGAKLNKLAGNDIPAMVKELSTLDKVMLELATMTDQELNVALETLAQNSNYSKEELGALADEIRAKKVVEIFKELSKSIQITKDKEEQLIGITNKYGNTVLTNADLILAGRDAYKRSVDTTINANARLAAQTDLNKAFEKYQKQLGVTRIDFDEYLRILSEIPDVTKDAGEGQDNLTKSAKNAIGPYQQLVKQVSTMVTGLQDLAALALRGNSLEVLGSKADQLKQAQFELALANNLVTISIGDYSKELEDLSKFMDGKGQFLFDIKGGKEQAAKIRELTDAYNEQLAKLKELKDINDQLKAQDEENKKAQQDRIDQEKQFAEERQKTQQQAWEFLKQLGFDINSEYQKQLNDLNAFYDAKLISSEEFVAALTAIQAKQVAAIANGLANLANTLNTTMSQIFGDAAEKNVLFLAFQKTLTIASIALSSAASIASGIEAITKALAKDAVDPVQLIGGIASIVAGIGNLVGGLTAQVNSIAAPQVPSFFEGTDYLQLNGNPKGKDTIPVMAHEGEAIIPTARNSENPGLAKAWINGDLDRFILTKYLPQYIEDQIVKDGGKEIYMNDWDDSEMQSKMEENTAATIQTNIILSKMVKSGKNPWAC